MKSFMSMFGACRNHISDVGGGNTYDDHTLSLAFDTEFRKIPEFRDVVSLKLRGSLLTSKYRTFDWQWQHAQQTLENMLADQRHDQLMAGCSPNAEDINTAALNTGGPKGNKRQPPMTDEEWKTRHEQYKDVACPRQVKDDTCWHHENGRKLFYSHNS